MRNFRAIEDKVFNKDQLREFISDGLCFKLEHETVDAKGTEGFHLNLDKMENWICEDDLDLFWEKNCLVLRPHINTCIDKLASAKRDKKRETLA